MNNYSSNILKLKINAEKIVEFDTSMTLYSPREDKEGNYYVCSHTGEIIKFDDNGSFNIFLTIGGQPTGIAFDSSNNLYYSDIANCVVYYKELNSCNENNNEFLSNNINSNSNNIYDNINNINNNLSHNESYNDKFNEQESEVYRKNYDGQSFKGPRSIVINETKDEERRLIYVDCGSMGSSSLNKPNGSVFIDDINSKQIHTLLYNCLSCPMDLAIDNSRNIVYVCETFRNRIIRIIITQNCFFSSVFYQFNGRIGPTAIAIDDLSGFIFVARYEYSNNNISSNKNSNKYNYGLISVLNREGNHIGDIYIPKYSEIIGLMLPSKKFCLYFTEKNSSCVFKIKLEDFYNQANALDEYNKMSI